ncbi:MAG TPA: hypothetical protein RMH99_20540 [Sandaracinaceae bacterium LLY-WYZ-13_1]|nr:hypothetical protein [Sandaracinaceae bacterium LLY-WYZ-13_1]
MRRHVWIPGLLPLVLLAGGCYLGHERPGPTDGASPSASTPRGPAPGASVDGGAAPGAPEAGAPETGAPTTPDGGGFPHDDEDVCEAMCAAAREAGCAIDGCYGGCDVRRWHAWDIGCYGEWKAATACLTEEPCRRDGSCGTDHGWRACVARRTD